MLIWDLLLLTGAAYGFSWIVTKSKIFLPIRTHFKDTPFLGSLLQCIVCVSFWVGSLLVIALPWTGIFSPAVRSRGLLDGVFLVGWVVFTTWGLGRLLGDAD